MSNEDFALTLTSDGLPVAQARLVTETDPHGELYAYMLIEQCPLCGGRHTHSAEKLYDAATGRVVGYAPSYRPRTASCAEDMRRAWERKHPEVSEMGHDYALSPAPVLIQSAPALRARLERGSSVVSVILMILPMLTVIDLIAAIAMGGYAQVNVAAAARNCVRMAAATLSSGLGPTQGQQMGLDTLKAAKLGNRDPKVNVSANGNWDRGGTVSCTVQVKMPFGALGLIGQLVGAHDLSIHETQSTVIEQWNSRWNN